MELTIDVDSPIPAYEQIRGQITELVESGALRAGTLLPSVRQLAADLQLAPGTIARAYRELESTGIVVSSRWAGTRVAEVVLVDRGERRRRLDDAASRMVSTARRLGARNSDIEAAVMRVLARSAQFKES